MNNNFYELIKQSTECEARLGKLHTERGIIDTPVFMPVGTYGSIKSVTNNFLYDSKVQIILSNSYHLYLRPGIEIIKKAGGIQKFNSWNKPMLTDSGGFQAFSLKRLKKSCEAGIEFKSHIDGSKHFITPEKSIKIQKAIGADFIMCFDECTPFPIDYESAKKSMELSLRWAKRCKKEFYNNNDDTQALFGIIQGSIYSDLRLESVNEMLNIGFNGYAIGGFSVGEPKEKYRNPILKKIVPILPKNKVRYLMGVGMPEDLWNCVELGIDMFDCVLPTRNGRNGQIFTNFGKLNIKNSNFKSDFTTLDSNCNCYTCSNYSRAFLHYLIKSKEILALTLLSLHNIRFMIDLMSKIRESLRNNTFLKTKNSFLEKYYLNNK
ncbi:MAG: tRNA guanosine(34) transglycosylase Tgt [Endomicrobium sp.]|jgi:queuine tRNA-ribosyltransferase|nr:tRNA guanosine(34) transglycosylase Tgt [Endomicrobium sp.]